MADNALSTAIKALSPAAYWKLGEASGTTAADEIGSYSGTYSPNSGGAWTGGVLGARSWFPGETVASVNVSTGVVSVTGLPITATDNLTYMLWCRSDLLNVAYPFYLGTLNTNGYGLRYSGSAWAVRVGGSNVGSVSATVAGWHYIAAVRRATAWYLYVDGAENNLSSTSAPTTPTGNTAIGAEVNSSPSFRWIGQIAHCAVFNSALSAANILAIYNAGIPALGGIIRTSMSGGFL